MKYSPPHQQQKQGRHGGTDVGDMDIYGKTIIG